MREPQKVGPGYVFEPLAPAVIWIAYFMVVYLFAEAACTYDFERWDTFGLDGVSVFTLAATLAAVGAIGYFTVRGWKQWRHTEPDSPMGSQTRALGLMGLVSGLIFIVATISLGLPALVIQPC